MVEEVVLDFIPYVLHFFSGETELLCNSSKNGFQIFFMATAINKNLVSNQILGTILIKCKSEEKIKFKWHWRILSCYATYTFELNFSPFLQSFKHKCVFLQIQLILTIKQFWRRFFRSERKMFSDAKGRIFQKRKEFQNEKNVSNKNGLSSMVCRHANEHKLAEINLFRINSRQQLKTGISPVNEYRIWRKSDTKVIFANFSLFHSFTNSKW